METKRMTSKTIAIIFTLAFINCSNVFASNIKSVVKSNEHTLSKEDRSIYPFIYFDLSMEGFYDNIKIEGGSRQDRLSTEANLLIDINLNQHFGIRSRSKLEKIKGEPENSLVVFNKDYLKKDESPLFGTSLTTKELSLFFKFDRASFFLGKIEPKFGAGSERRSDIFYEDWYGVSGTKVNSSYNLDEKLGLLAAIDIVNIEGTKIVFEASLFKNDSTDLYKKPFLEKRQILGFVTPFTDDRVAGDKISHALSIQGFVSLTRRDIVSFGIAYKNQASDKYSTERGVVFDGQYTRTFFNDLTVSVFSEVAFIENAYAIEGVKERFITNGISSSFAGFKIGVVKNNYRIEENKVTSKLKALEYFVGFEVPKTELGFFITYKQQDINSSDYDGFGFSVRYRIR